LPIVDVELDCSGERPALNLRQQRFAPAAAEAAASQQWRFPFCVRAEGMAAPQCVMLVEASQRVPLREAPHCPAWLLPNPGGNGYFLSRLPASLSKAVPASALSEQEAVALLGEQALLANSGGLPLAHLLDLVRSLAKDSRPAVMAAAATAVQGLPLQLFTREERQNLAAWTRQQFGERALQLGWMAQEGDPDAVRQLRRAVVPLVAGIGQEPQLRAQARALALAWLKDERRPLGSLRGDILRTAARGADAVVFDAFVAAVRKTQDVNRRVDILAALGTAQDPVLLNKALELGLAPDMDLRESQSLYEEAAANADNAQATFAFVRAHYDALALRLPDDMVVRVPRWHASLCSAEDRDALRGFFADPARARRPGSARALAQALEQVELCVRNAEYQRAAGPLLPAGAEN
jgi:alanyl aminopeptidase